jgi:hypothetical protein
MKVGHGRFDDPRVQGFLEKEALLWGIFQNLLDIGVSLNRIESNENKSQRAVRWPVQKHEH